jgi:hypothetical protein
VTAVIFSKIYFLSALTERRYRGFAVTSFRGSRREFGSDIPQLPSPTDALCHKKAIAGPGTQA